MKKFENKEKNISIFANEIEIGENVSFGKNIQVRLKGKFKIGNYRRFGKNNEIFENNESFGEHLYHSSRLKIDGGRQLHRY